MAVQWMTDLTGSIMENVYHHHFNRIRNTGEKVEMCVAECMCICIRWIFLFSVYIFNHQPPATSHQPTSLCSPSKASAPPDSFSLPFSISCLHWTSFNSSFILSSYLCFLCFLFYFLVFPFLQWRPSSFELPLLLLLLLWFLLLMSPNAPNPPAFFPSKREKFLLRFLVPVCRRNVFLISGLPPA